MIYILFMLLVLVACRIIFLSWQVYLISVWKHGLVLRFCSRLVKSRGM